MNEKNIQEAAKEARRAYYRAYRKAHPEKIREQNRKYWERRAAKAAAEQEAANAG